VAPIDTAAACVMQNAPDEKKKDEHTHLFPTKLLDTSNLVALLLMNVDAFLFFLPKHLAPFASFLSVPLPPFSLTGSRSAAF
jgi:hypothetical protein